MSEAMEFTASSQLKSANTVSDVANHSGKANRAKLEHANPEIDTSLSHLNVELDFYEREELLEAHYREKIDKHNQTNNSKARRWETMDDFLASFEGKKVRHKGKETKNERWATASQISYFGNKDSLEALGDVLSDAGISEGEILETYAKAYEGYVRAHNEHFKTLPIYHSDIHFDETTPHGHDCIVVMGHTATGKPSDSINNALAEHYGFPTGANGKKRAPNFAEKTENMRRYRADNDSLLFANMSERFGELAASRGLDISFKAIRTGQERSYEYPVYKAVKDEEARLEGEEERLGRIKMGLSRRSEKLNAREKSLDEREAELAAREKQVEEQRSEQQIIATQNAERSKRLDEQENQLEADRVFQRKNGFLAGRMIWRECTSNQAYEDITSDVAEQFFRHYIARKGTMKPKDALGNPEREWTNADHLRSAKLKVAEQKQSAREQVVQRDTEYER